MLRSPLSNGELMSATADILAVTDATFEERVLQADRPVLLKFDADWCGPCQAMKPTIAELANEYGNRVTIATLDIDQNGQTPHRLGVRGVPTLMLFKDGSIVDQRIGLTRKADLVAMLERQIAR